MIPHPTAFQGTYITLIICIPTRNRCYVSHSDNPPGHAPFNTLCTANNLDEPRPT